MKETANKTRCQQQSSKHKTILNHVFVNKNLNDTGSTNSKYNESFARNI